MMARGCSFTAPGVRKLRSRPAYLAAQPPWAPSEPDAFGHAALELAEGAKAVAATIFVIRPKADRYICEGSRRNLDLHRPNFGRKERCTPTIEFFSKQSRPN